MSSIAQRAGLRADWVHEHLRLELGKNIWYRFKTLSLYDVWKGWPHLLAFAREFNLIPGPKPGPIAVMQEHLPELLRLLNPTLAQRPEHFGLISPSAVSLLIDFYRKQDWARIRILGGTLESGQTAPGAEREPVDEGDADRRFLAIVMAASKAAEMSVTEFLQERFEFCADVIINLREAIEGERNKNKMTVGQWASIMSAVLPHEKPEPDSRTGAILREMNERAAKAETN
jgi:hypothetical protein